MAPWAPPPRLTAACPLRAGVFLGLGLSGVVPTMHFTIAEGFVKATTVGQMGWFFLMAVMYITGAGLYAARIPERFFPGKFDIWVRSGPPGSLRSGTSPGPGVWRGSEAWAVLWDVHVRGEAGWESPMNRLVYF